MADRSLPQIVAYKFLIDRGYDEELGENDVKDSSELTPDIIQNMINTYCQEEGEDSVVGLLHETHVSPEEHFDFAYDMGVAMTVLRGGIK